mmetsp:Transcript_20850/g.61991  ORF Transcript_20850/g.61991 Transcript_20850/m.61991 type:complete len:111 (-) Transcript_20850:168-500(-)|eukprot:5943481-Prymnesium_polylepis.1
MASNGEGLVRGEHQIGEYRGEVYTLEGMQKRYGKGGKIAVGCVEWHKKWSDRPQARGVGITGSYVFTVADALTLGAKSCMLMLRIPLTRCGHATSTTVNDLIWQCGAAMG